MTVKILTPQVWYGNWEAPFEVAKNVGSVLNVAHHFRESRGRDKYWDNLKHIPYTVPLFRLALRDKDTFTPEYARAFAKLLDVVIMLNAFPLLTHCQMGGHCGPSAAVFAAWYIGNRQKGSFVELFQKAFPNWTNDTKGNYRRTMREYCREYEGASNGSPNR